MTRGKPKNFTGLPCRCRRKKRILAPDPENIEKEPCAAVMVNARKTDEGRVLRDPFSSKHIRGHHYSLKEIQGALDGTSQAASRSSIARWEKRYSCLHIIVLHELREALGTKIDVARRILSSFLKNHENWLHALLLLYFIDEEFEKCVNFGHSLLRAMPYFSQDSLRSQHCMPELSEEMDKGG